MTNRCNWRSFKALISYDKKYYHKLTTKGYSLVQNLLLLLVFALSCYRSLFCFFIFRWPKSYWSATHNGSPLRRGVTRSLLADVCGLSAAACSLASTLAVDFWSCCHLLWSNQCVLFACLHSFTDFLDETRCEAVFWKEMSKIMTQSSLSVFRFTSISWTARSLRCFLLMEKSALWCAPTTLWHHERIDTKNYGLFKNLLRMERGSARGDAQVSTSFWGKRHHQKSCVPLGNGNQKQARLITLRGNQWAHASRYFWRWSGAVDGGQWRCAKNRRRCGCSYQFVLHWWAACCNGAQWISQHIKNQILELILWHVSLWSPRSWWIRKRAAFDFSNTARFFIWTASGLINEVIDALRQFNIGISDATCIMRGELQ